jgi:hypothetical protein
MGKPKPRNSLLVKKMFADLIAVIVEEVKDEFKNLSIEDVKQDMNFILFVMEKIDNKSENKNIVNPKIKDKIDKNALVVEIVKQLLPKVVQSELDAINYAMDFILSNKVIKKKSQFFESAIKFLGLSSDK